MGVSASAIAAHTGTTASRQGHVRRGDRGFTPTSARLRCQSAATRPRTCLRTHSPPAAPSSRTPRGFAERIVGRIPDEAPRARVTSPSNLELARKFGNCPSTSPRLQALVFLGDLNLASGGLVWTNPHLITRPVQLLVAPPTRSSAC